MVELNLKVIAGILIPLLGTALGESALSAIETGAARISPEVRHESIVIESRQIHSGPAKDSDRFCRRSNGRGVILESA